VTAKNKAFIRVLAVVAAAGGAWYLYRQYVGSRPADPGAFVDLAVPSPVPSMPVPPAPAPAPTVSQVQTNAQSLLPIIEDIKRRHTFLTLPSSVVLAVVDQESSFRPGAMGGAGEVGLMQIKPATAQWMSEKYGLPLADLRQVRPNLLAGMYYLQQQINRTGSISAGLAAYNAGYAGWQKGRGLSYSSAVMLKRMRYLTLAA
jgi:soluble lytic murein transglycosylase-like protein